MAFTKMRFEPGDFDEAAATVDLLMARFQGWLARRGLKRGAREASDLELLLNWKVNYGDGRLDTWTTTEIDEFILDWCPRKVSAPPEWVAPMAQALADGFVFLGEEGLLALGSERPQRLGDRARSLVEECERRMGDTSNFGMAKSLVSGMGLDSGEASTEDLDAVMERFNALPFDERKAMTDPALPKAPVVGPVFMPDHQQACDSAAGTPVMIAFEALSDYFAAPGRLLTTSGNIKLADAQALSDILGTETLAVTIGSETYRRRSATDMPDLDFLQWWAREAGVLRVVKTRLVAVRAWRERARRDPLGEAQKALGVLLEHGTVRAYRPYSLVGREVIDSLVVPLMLIPLTSAEPVETGLIEEAAQGLYTTFDAALPFPFQDPAFQKDRVSQEVDLMLTAMQWAGVVSREQSDGNTVSVTPFGVLSMVERFRDQGVTVETIDVPERMTAAELAQMAREQRLGAEHWWDLVGRWLSAQQDRPVALLALFEEMGPVTLMTALFVGTPEVLNADLAEALMRVPALRGPLDDLAIAGYGWLFEQGLLSEDDVTPEAMGLQVLALYGLVATSEPVMVVTQWSDDRSRAELLTEVTEIGRLMPMKADALLEAIGANHPDKVVAKAARTQLRKVRSRAASRS